VPPLLLIHGMWSRPSAFGALIPELEACGISTRAPALLHHDIPAGSPAPAALGTLRLGDYVEQVVREVRALGDLPVILGHSMGGLIAQLVAARTGAAGLILLATAPSASARALSFAQVRTLRRVTGRWGWWRSPTLLDAESARSGVMNGVSEAETRAAIADLTWDSGAVLAQISAPSLDSTRGAVVDYGRLTMPALVIFGMQDRIATEGTSRATVRQLAGPTDYETWDDCGHWFFHDAIRPRLAERIGRFIASLA
jgi:pimeloyl-ACP methyl ester carboxylesterase